jgi:hypothetical protein
LFDAYLNPEFSQRIHSSTAAGFEINNKLPRDLSSPQTNLSIKSKLQNGSNTYIHLNNNLSE